MAETPTFTERVAAAWKTLRGETKSLTHPSAGYGVSSYGSWANWDRSAFGGYQGTREDFASKVGDLSLSSLVRSGTRWAGNTLPEAPVQVKKTTGKKGESEVVPNHPLTQLWRRPNPFYSGSTMMKGFAFSWITKGDVYVRKVWNTARTRVVELWYEPHWLIRPRWLNDNRGAYIFGEGDDPNAFITYYELDRMGQKYRVELSDVIHFRDGINPETRCGHNGIASILREIYGDNEAANMFAALMANDGIPKVILVADPDVDIAPDKLKELTDDVNRKSTGDNRRKAMALSGVKPYKLPWSPDELDVRSSRYMSEDRFCAVTGIPAVELELGAGRESSIYNNVRQASERATERFLCPTWDHIGEELTVQLLADFEGREKALTSVKSLVPHRGQLITEMRTCWAVKAADGSMTYVEHDLSKVRALAEDQDALHERVGKDYQSGIIMRSEARSALGYGPSDEADEEADKVFFKDAQPAQTQPDNLQPPPVKSAQTPKAEVVDEVVDFFDAKLAPEGAVGILSAKVVMNGNGKR